jgi:hypothetical protein
MKSGNEDKVMTEETKEGKTQKKNMKIKLHKPDHFNQVYAIGAMGGHSPYDFRICFYNDTPRGVSNDNEQVIERNLESEVILSPLAALELSRWLDQHIKEYEAAFGPISRKSAQSTSTKKPVDDDSSHLQGYI